MQGRRMESLSALGMMSGTSLDGVDVAMLHTDGVEIADTGPSCYRPYTDAERTLLRQALAAAVSLPDRTTRSDILRAAEDMVTRVHAEAVESFSASTGMAVSDIAVIGFHGQTVLHRPERKLTVQIGDPAALAKRLRCPVVADLRQADVAAGGQGAPLVPVYHQALVRGLDRPGPVCVVNIGGVGNITYLEGDGEPIACDTGPGNALLDDFVRLRTGATQDADGRLAARGHADLATVERLMAHPYFLQPPPKSLDRNDFRNWVAERGGLGDMTTEDGAATLTRLTVETLARVVDLLPQPPRSWIVAGGGAHNPTLMAMLSDRLAPATVETAAQAGWSVDAMEAQAFAYLAARSLRGLPLTFPGTTGIAAPLTGGVLYRP